MKPTFRRIGAAALSAAALAAALTVPAAATPHSSGPNAFRGVTWVDPRDNYADDEVVPSGLSTADDYQTTYRKATGIVGEFRKELKANTIRLPINPSSVGTAWWNSYRGAIDASVAKGNKVILSYWEADNAKDGRIDDPAKYTAMWDTVVKAYSKNPHHAGRSGRPPGEQPERSCGAVVGLGPAEEGADEHPAARSAGEPLRGVASGRCVDVPGFSTSPGTALDQWDCNNGGNQSWNYTATKQLTVYTDKCMTAGTSTTIEACTGASNQAWELNADQTVTSVATPTLCLTATGTGNGAAVTTAPCNGSDDQKWTRS